MKKAIFACILCVCLLALGIYEIVAVQNIISTLTTSTSELKEGYEKNELDITVMTQDITDLKEFWKGVECNLCLMFNHKDLSTITDSINKLESYTINNDYDNAIAEINLLIGYAEKTDHIMGFNIHNIF